MQLLVSLKLLMALLGSSCPLLGRSGPKMGHKMGPKSSPKSYQKVVQKMIPKITKNVPILDPRMGPKMGKDDDSRAQAQPSGRCLGSSWSQDAPKMPQDGLK